MVAMQCSRRLIPILILLLIASSALARTKKTAFVDDDWNPIERGRSYTADPGYEFYIQEALDLAGVNYDVFEIHPDDGPPNLPALAELAEYPLLIWNCAAETEFALEPAERQLIRSYRELGGKVLLSGQGILDGLQDELDQDPGNPEILEFIQQQLGLDSYWLNAPVQVIFPPTSGVPYLDFLPPFVPDYSGLPDDDPDQIDLLFPGSAPDAFFLGEIPSGQQEAVSTDRYLLDAIHFQSFMPEAIADPNLRAEYLTAVMAWLGYEGDELLDFMNDSDLFGKISDSPADLIEWSALLNAMAFNLSGDSQESSIWRMALTPTDSPCDWRIGFSHRLGQLDPGIGIVLLELLADQSCIRIETQPDSGDPALYGLRFSVKIGGSLLFDDGVSGLTIGDKIRVHLTQRDSPLRLELRVLDRLGNAIGAFDLNGIAPEFSLLQFRSIAGGEMHENGTQGWIDDYFLAGCLASGTTQADAAPAAVPGISVHPNPFNPRTRIGIEMPRADRIQVTVHDLAGRRLRTLDAGWRGAGRSELTWDGRDAEGRPLGSGVYLVWVESSAGGNSRKLVLLK